MFLVFTKNINYPKKGISSSFGPERKETKGEESDSGEKDNGF